MKLNIRMAESGNTCHHHQQILYKVSLGSPLGKFGVLLFYFQSFPLVFELTQSSQPSETILAFTPVSPVAPAVADLLLFLPATH